NPHLMDELVTAVGVEVVQWAFKTECCGASLTLTRSDLIVERVHLILTDARDAGADIVCVACPLCHVNLDLYQPDADARFQIKHNMPILYFTQLIGLAIGISPTELGLNKHRINPMPLLREKGVVA
ncbi:MAG TPA: heterodisulfide reductase subunit B, partial [Armatimonadetes bacterium]|nr:heterodisulfide reductase subunit B [Armatimonadota bacterium]